MHKKRSKFSDDIEALKMRIGLKTLIFHVHNICAGYFPKVKAQNTANFLRCAFFIFVIPLVFNSNFHNNLNACTGTVKR